MYKRIAIKNHLEEIQLITRRSISALVIMLLLALILIIRLGYLQLSQHDLYTTLSKKNWLDLVPLEPTRGLIYDRHGILLAENIPIFSLDVIPDKIQNLPKTLAEISKLVPLSDTDIAQFQKELKQHRRFDEIPLKLRLSETEVAKFSENQYRFPGFLIKARLMRHYPRGDSFSHVLGYVGRINIDELKDIDVTNYSASNYIGKLGVEKFYEDDLHGTVGYEQAENDASGAPIRVLNQIHPIAGKNLYLTIDAELQMVAEQALTGFRGAIVAIQPSTGQILAMVSEPSFDPNIFVDGISNIDFQNLQQSPDKPLYNRALRGLYPIGSTIKPFFALQGLNTGVITPSTTIFDPGWFKLKNTERVFHDWQHRGHGTVNLSKAIINSCDTYFYELATKLGVQHMDDVLTQFGFGDLTGVDLGEEIPGTVPSPDWKKRVKGEAWYLGDTVNMGIGQGYMQATPLQLAVGVAAIANRGIRYTPYIVQGEQEPGKAYKAIAPTPTDPVPIKDPVIWSNVINAMQKVVEDPTGTMHLFGPAPYTVAGKTGTAQVFSVRIRNSEGKGASQASLPERLRDHSLLIVFAPVDKPQIALAIIVENSSLSLSAENHGPAVGIARKLLDYYFLNIQPTQTNTPTVSTNNGTHPIP